MDAGLVVKGTGDGGAVTGRRENSLDPAAGPVARFAFELRKLRQKAGDLTYRDMARKVPYATATLAQAAAGVKLPSLPVTLAYVTACGGDAEEWERRWHEAAAAERAEVLAVPPYPGLRRFQPEVHAMVDTRLSLPDGGRRPRSGRRRCRRRRVQPERPGRRGSRQARPTPLSRWITSRTVSSSAWTSWAITGTRFPPAEASSIIARRNRTELVLPRRTSCCSFYPS